MAQSHGVQKYVQGTITKCMYKNGNVQIIILYQWTKSINHTLIQVVNKIMATVAVLGQGVKPLSLSTQCLCLPENSAETLPTRQQHHLLHTVTPSSLASQYKCNFFSEVPKLLRTYIFGEVCC